MFTYFYHFYFYRFWKSGMLLDFFFKKLIFYKLYFLFYIFNIKFSEKYFIEYNFLRINNYILYLKNIIDYFNNQFVIYTLGLVLAFLFFILCIICL